MRSTFVFSLVLLFAMSLLSCSGAGSPISMPPDMDVTGAQSPQASSGGSCLWGLWDVTIDPSTAEVKIVPERGANFTVNIVNFLQPPMVPIHMLQIEIDTGESNFAAGKVVCDVTIQHPFPGTKFCGFDVRGIVMSDHPGHVLQGDSDIKTELYPFTILKNYDGYTRWWNQPEFTTYGTLFGYIEANFASHGWTSTMTLNPYKYFSDDLDSDDPFEPGLATRGFFSAFNPGVNTRRYELQFPGAGGIFFRYKYAISANWVPPDDADPPYTPDSFKKDANQPEAYKIDIIDDGSTAYYESASNFGGELNILVEARDWQFNGDPDKIDDEFAGIRIESPTLFTGSIDLDMSTAMLVFGDPTAIRVPVTIVDVTPTGVENQLLIVTVLCADPPDYSPQVPGLTGYDYPSGPLAAYNILQAPISALGPQNESPVADASATTPTSGPDPLTVQLDPSLSYDPDGTIVLYEWDFDDDGVYDWSGATPDIVYHIYAEGVYVVTLRVTDNDDATDTDEVTINSQANEDISWKMLHKDFTRRGLTTATGPVTNHVEWTFNAGDDIMSGIVLDNDNRAYFRSNNGYIYCVNPDGSEGWSYFVGGTYDYNTPAVANDGSIYVTNTEGRLYHFLADGTFDWCTDFGGDYGLSFRGVSVNPDDTLFFMANGGFLVKLLPGSSVVWDYPVNGNMNEGPTKLPDGRLVIATNSGEVHGILPDGTNDWITSGLGTMYTSPVISGDHLFVANGDGQLHKLDFEGNVEWTVDIAGGTNNSYLAVGHDGMIYMGSQDAHLYKIFPGDGQVDWSYPVSDGIGSSAPVIDSAGNIYFGNYSGVFTCVSQDGNYVWDLDTGTNIYCKSPAITTDGMILTGTNDGMLYAFRDE